MKAITALLTFLLFSICTHSFLLCSAAETPDAVIDIDGNPLRAGVEYYILPVLRPGAGLTMSSFGNETCPLGVVQEILGVDNGIPVTFTPENPKEGVVRVSTDLNVRFFLLTNCVQSNVWEVDFDDTIGKYVILLNGVEGNPGPQTLKNWFKIEKHESFYKLRFSPTVCEISYQIIRKDVGVFIQDGKRRLALTDDQPFQVFFKKVPRNHLSMYSSGEI